MSSTRRCSRSGCGRRAVTTLTYVYAEQMAVLGPLATYAEPHAYDLCDQHSERLSAPRGWEVMRLATDYTAPPPTTDDLLALADAVREAARPDPGPRVPIRVAPQAPVAPSDAGAGGVALLDGERPGGVRRRHLRSLPPETDPTDR